MSKLTSVEWLINEITIEMNVNGDVRVFDEILKEAKEMHKQEIIDTYKNAQALVMLDPTKRAEQYFYELYEKRKKMKTYLAYIMIRNIKWGRSNKKELHGGSYYNKGRQSRYIKLKLKQIKNEQ